MHLYYVSILHCTTYISINHVGWTIGGYRHTIAGSIPAYMADACVCVCVCVCERMIVVIVLPCRDAKLLLWGGLGHSATA